MEPTIPLIAMLCLGFALCGFTFGVIVMDIKFLEPQRKLTNEAIVGWKHCIELLEKAVAEMPVKSPLQIKQD